MPEPKHAGCAKCGSREEPVLFSVKLPDSGIGQALCSKGRKAAGVE